MTLSIRPLGREDFVAEVRGIDLRAELSDSLFAELRTAYIKYAVLIIPGQDLDIDRQLAVAERFGPLETIPKRKSGAPRRIEDRRIDDISNLDADGNLAGGLSEKVLFALGNQLWHSDLSFRSKPATLSMLVAHEIAPEGGETEFCDLRAAYRALPAERRQALAGKLAKHSLMASRQKSGYAPTADDWIQFPPGLQPLVRLNGESGQTGLFLSSDAYAVEGMDAAAGAALIDELMTFATQPRFVYSHRWAVHDLVMWDNRSTMHRGRPYDVEGCRRVMYRATVTGPADTVVDGQIVVGA
jgi:alpha-ketoglutarate-dependent 2,4-dichlorophenoxyacetate dioxygenase